MAGTRGNARLLRGAKLGHSTFVPYSFLSWPKGLHEPAARIAARERFDTLPASIRGSLTDIDLFIETVVRREMRFVQSPWFDSIVQFDPDPVHGRLTVPVLALYGELDTQVSAEINSEALSQAVVETGNLDYTVTTIAGANHLFQEGSRRKPQRIRWAETGIRSRIG